MAEELESLQAKVEKLEAENEKLKAKVKAIEEKNVMLEIQRQKDAAEMAALHAKTARAESEASNLKKLLAHDGPYDPVSKYD